MTVVFPRLAKFFMTFFAYPFSSSPHFGIGTFRTIQKWPGVLSVSPKNFIHYVGDYGERDYGHYQINYDIGWHIFFEDIQL